MICYYDVFDWSCSLFPLSHRLIAITITLWGTTSCLMYCVTDFARIADGTGSSLVSASLQSFIGFPLCHDWFCRYCVSHYPLPVSGSNRCCSYHPFRSAHASAVWLGLSCLNIRSMVGVHHARSLAYLTVVVCPSLFTPIRHCADALYQLYFFISILILALYLFILREVTKREPVFISGSSVDCLTALDNDFSMNLPFSLPTSLCLWAINKTCIHR